MATPHKTMAKMDREIMPAWHWYKVACPWIVAAQVVGFVAYLFISWLFG